MMIQSPGLVLAGQLKSSECPFAPYLVVDAAHQPGPQLDCLLEHLHVVSPVWLLGLPYNVVAGAQE